MNAFLVLMIFYLFLAVRYQHVRLPGMFFLGLCGMALVFLASVVASTGLSDVMVRITGVLQSIGQIAAFFFGILACYSSERTDRMAAKLGRLFRIAPPDSDNPGQPEPGKESDDGRA